MDAVPMAIYVDSLIIMDWSVTKGNLHHSMATHEHIDSVRKFYYILGG